MRIWLPALLLAACRLPACAQTAARDLPPAGPVAPLAFGRCALGPVATCFERLLLGLAPEDRPHATLDGSAVRVDPAHESASPNFAALRRAALQNGRPTRIEVLAPAEDLTIKTFQRWPAAEPEAVSMRMGSPRTNDGFEGYTFFPFLGKHHDGIIYSAGAYTVVAVNTDQSPVSLTEALHHELRHVLLGGFGLTPAQAKHQLAATDTATREAQDESRRNAER